MKVVHVTQPVEAGVAVVVLALAKAQQTQGWEVTIACPPGWLADEARTSGIPVHPWHATRSPGPRTARGRSTPPSSPRKLEHAACRGVFCSGVRPCATASIIDKAKIEAFGTLFGWTSELR